MLRWTARQLTLVAVFGLASSGVGQALAAAESRPSRAEKRFEQLKELAGTWVTLDEDGSPTEEVASIYQVTAGGTALMETVFPGTNMEMVTLYHVDGNELMLTHYCMVGNQPRMKEVPRKSGKRKLVFECVGGTGMESESESHMHHAQLELKSPDRLSTRWLMVEDGEVTYTAASDLVRRDSAPISTGHAEK